MPDSGVTSKPVRLMHLSDIHFGTEDRDALEAVAAFASRVKPDAIIIAGDITQSGRKSEFEAARVWFDSLAAPVITALGNHDTPVYHLPARETPLGGRAVAAGARERVATRRAHVGERSRREHEQGRAHGRGLGQESARPAAAEDGLGGGSREDAHAARAARLQ